MAELKKVGPARRGQKRRRQRRRERNFATLLIVAIGNKKLEIRNKKVARSKSLQLLQGRVKKLCNLAHRGWRGRHATAVAFYVRGE
jgi:hypothetical protein